MVISLFPLLININISVGVIWNNGIPIPGAVDTINYLKNECK
jgi:hypothetical protein